MQTGFLAIKGLERLQHTLGMVTRARRPRSSRHRRADFLRPADPRIADSLAVLQRDFAAQLSGRSDTDRHTLSEASRGGLPAIFDPRARGVGPMRACLGTGTAPAHPRRARPPDERTAIQPTRHGRNMTRRWAACWTILLAEVPEHRRPTRIVESTSPAGIQPLTRDRTREPMLGQRSPVWATGRRRFRVAVPDWRVSFAMPMVLLRSVARCCGQGCMRCRAGRTGNEGGAPQGGNLALADLGVLIGVAAR